ncbi:acyl-CoA dehydrogenase family protein [Thermoflexus sp.]|uniref:acyl-CoA dehydrogenase family protein n=1 Tax=Thermoflexus sp. TaxID=1969742 RepID=UPI002ADDE8E6|nr:acyl-CoA dehydrogenase family protein [Thermoflexus sp.]
MDLDALRTPTRFLQSLGLSLPPELELQELESWWEAEGNAISMMIDRLGTPWLRAFDRFGRRVDEILYPPDYRRMLLQGYRAGAVWHAFEGAGLPTAFLVGYLTAFYDAGLYCPYTVSLATALALHKYGDAELQARFLPPLLRRDGEVWQGATWMTEAGGGSDLGATVETVARPEGSRWRLTGEKYFASNVGAELALVAARPEGAPRTVRGLALFLLPRYREDGGLNYTIRRLKDKIGTRAVPTGEVELRHSEAYLLGRPEDGIYLILEALNVSRVSNSIGSVALMQRAMAEAFAFAERRIAFGRPILQHPLLRRQFEERLQTLRAAFALAWTTVHMLDAVRKEQPPYSPRYHLFRLLTHLAKYWTAEQAVQTAKWAMEVHGGIGVLGEYPVERWLREAMILPIWEGTPHRQILDGLEAMARKGAHHLLMEFLFPEADPRVLEEMRERVEAHLRRTPEEQEAEAEPLFRDLARFAAETLIRRYLRAD